MLIPVQPVDRLNTGGEETPPEPQDAKKYIVGFSLRSQGWWFIVHCNICNVCRDKDLVLSFMI